MNKTQRITAIAILALSIFGIWSSVTHSQVEGTRRRSPDDREARKEPNQPSRAGMSAEEKLVRDVYARLMRYQSAAVDELAAKNKKQAKPDDYFTFELRAIHSGPIQEIYAKPMAAIVTPRRGNVLTITPNHVGKSNDVQHAYYVAEWASADSQKQSIDELPELPREDPRRQIDNRTVAEMLAGDAKRFADVTEYASYQVTARLKGKQRTYRALVVYRVKANGNSSYETEAARINNLAGVEILDNVTSEMNTVLRDASPYARSPWEKYSKSSLYIAVIRTIRETKEAGKPLIPVDAPIGYLPGDDVYPNTSDNQMLLTDASCRPSITGPHAVWWFKGEAPSGYATQITLSTTSAASSWHWAVVAGTSKVTLTDADTPSVTVISAGASDNPNDVGIQVSVDGQASDQFNITVKAPTILHRTSITHTADGQWGYFTRISYAIQDQFTTQLPSDVAANEQWTTGLISDYPGNNWLQAVEGGGNAPNAILTDYIQGQQFSQFPTPQFPQSPLGTTKVHHWGQDLFVGSTTAGAGRRVQSQIQQKYTDHADHENVVTPNPN